MPPGYGELVENLDYRLQKGKLTGNSRLRLQTHPAVLGWLTGWSMDKVEPLQGSSPYVG